MDLTVINIVGTIHQSKFDAQLWPKSSIKSMMDQQMIHHMKPMFLRFQLVSRLLMLDWLLSATNHSELPLNAYMLLVSVSPVIIFLFELIMVFFRCWCSANSSRIQDERARCHGQIYWWYDGDHEAAREAAAARSAYKSFWGRSAQVCHHFE